MARIEEFFDFSKRERNGIIVLAIIIFFMIVANIIVAQLTTKNAINYTKFKSDIEIFEKRQQFLSDSIKNLFENRYEKKEEYDFYNISNNSSNTKKVLTPFPFNPNNLPIEEWQKLGLTEKQIKSIKNYESKGGKFYKKEDFKKMYSISENEYTILEPYIVIPKDTTRKWENPKNLFAEQKIELNSADTIELQKIPGISESLARRIFKQKEKLGGFFDIEQLKEVWGVDSARIVKISKYLFVDKTKIKKININNAEIKELVKHPYLDYYMAKSIVVHRNKNGKYKNVSDIKNATLIYDELYYKLIPYLTVN